MVVTVGASVLLSVLLPGATGEARAFVALVLVVVLLLVLAPRFFSWRELGVNGPRHWRHVGLLAVPAVLSVTPLVLGVEDPGPSRLAFLTVGYLLTGFGEELLWRGLVQRILAPLGVVRAVLLSSALFGAAHLANLAFRDSPGLVLAQAWGAFCFGVGYGAVRSRTNTVVPLMVLHLVTDLAAAVGAVPKIPVLVAQDVVLLGFGLVLLRRTRPALDRV